MSNLCTTSAACLEALVQEKAGGPMMHVIAVAEVRDDHLVQCVWHDETNEVVVGTFRLEDLVGTPTQGSWNSPQPSAG